MSKHNENERFVLCHKMKTIGTGGRIEESQKIESGYQIMEFRLIIIAIDGKILLLLIFVGRCWSLWAVVDHCVGHCRWLWVVVDHCGSLWIVVGHCRSLWVIPHFSKYRSRKRPTCDRIVSSRHFSLGSHPTKFSNRRQMSVISTV